jgi:uncharacterized protein
MTQPGYPGHKPMTTALSLLRAALDGARHQIWPDDISIADAAIFDHSRILGPKQITDIYLLELAVKHGGRLVTLDRGLPLAAVRGAEPRHLAVV